MAMQSIGRLRSRLQRPLWNAFRVSLSTDLEAVRSKSREQSINRVYLLGRVGSDPKSVDFASGRSLVAFQMVTNKYHKTLQPDGSKSWEERATWHSINVFQPGKRDYVIQYVKKGSRIIVNGRLDSTAFSKDGGVKTYVNVIADDVILVHTPAKKKGLLTDGEPLHQEKEPVLPQDEIFGDPDELHTDISEQRH